MECNNFEVYLGFILFALSELMPFIKKMKGNGFCDILYCAFRHSKCLEGLELEEENDDNQSSLP